MIKKILFSTSITLPNCFYFTETSPAYKKISNAQFHIQKFESLQFKLTESRKRVSDLSKQMELAQMAKITKTTDIIRKLVCKMTGSYFETSAVKNLREELIMHRNQLQKKIEESDKKWQGPRQQILKLRKQISEDFLKRFTHLQDQMQKVINSNLNNIQLAQGVQLTHRLLLSTLQRHGIQFYQPTMGTKFNPEEHQTVSQTNQNSIVKQVIARGWKIQDQVIKKAIVKIQ